MNDPNETYDVIVIGAGAAGLMAAAEAGLRSRRTLLLEKNIRPGVKILMSGGTRCNLTQSTDAVGIAKAYGAQGRFLRSPLAALGPSDLVAMMDAEGVATKVESTGKIFPVSDSAADVVDAFVRRATNAGVVIAYGEPCRAIDRDGDAFFITTEKRTLRATSIILTTGGKSYPGSGATGDGYAWAVKFGHSIVPLQPALTPIATSEAWLPMLKGMTLGDAIVEVVPRSNPNTNKPMVSCRGGLLIAHFGLTGPAALNASRAISRHPVPAELAVRINWNPEFDRAKAATWIVEACQKEGRKSIAAILAMKIPRRLADAHLEQAGIPAERRGAELPKAERDKLATMMAAQVIAVHGVLGYAKAEVTSGGVSLDEVDSKTMQSRLQPGFYLAGEILDLDGPIGGYNFQAAFSTGLVAGRNA